MTNPTKFASLTDEVNEIKTNRGDGTRGHTALFLRMIELLEQIEINTKST